MGALARRARRVLGVAATRRRRRAAKEGRFDNEFAPIAGLTTDEIIRPGTTLETLAGLRPAFYNPAYAARFPQIDWTVTAGNSSPLSDGARRC